MTLGTDNGQSIEQAVSDAIERNGNHREDLIPVLTDVNRTLGYLPANALEAIGARLRVPKSQLFSVASFYQMLSTKPRGKHVIQFCESAPCHVVGGREVWEALQNELKLKAGETSPDRQWTLETVSCLGVCAVGPVIVIDEDIYGNVDPAQVPDILAHYSDEGGQE
jgi:NADH-quinone oxidoreductase subunit E